MYSTAFYPASFQHPPHFGDDFHHPLFHPLGGPFGGLHRAHEHGLDSLEPFDFGFGRGGRGGRGGGPGRGFDPRGYLPPPPFGADPFDFTAHGPPHHHPPPPPPSFDAGPFGFHPHGPPHHCPRGGPRPPFYHPGPPPAPHCGSPPHSHHHGDSGLNAEDRDCLHHSGEAEWEILTPNYAQEVHDTGHPSVHRHHGSGIHRPSSAPPEVCRDIATSPPPEAERDRHDNRPTEHCRFGHDSPFRHPHGPRGGPPGMRGGFASPRGSAFRRGGPPSRPFHLHGEAGPPRHMPWHSPPPGHHHHHRTRHTLSGRGGFVRGGFRGRSRCRCHEGRPNPGDTQSETETTAEDQAIDSAPRETVSEDHDREQVDDIMHDKSDAGEATLA